MGFKGGFAAFSNAFMDSMKEATKQKQLDAERADQKARQAEEDSWRKEQRERERKNFAEADALKQKLADAAKPVDVMTAQHGPIDQSGQQLPDIKTGATRPKMTDEILDETAKVYQGQGNPVEAIKLQQAADAERAQRSVQAYNKFYAAAQNLPPEQQVQQAIQIFNNDPSLGHIENVRPNQDGTMTMDVFNKKTGQRVTTTMKPNDLLTGLRMHYDQAGAMAEKAKAAEEAKKIVAYKPGDVLYKNGQMFAKIPDRLKVGGVGGGSGVDGKDGSGSLPDPLAGFDPKKSYQQHLDAVNADPQYADKGTAEKTTEALKRTNIEKSTFGETVKLEKQMAVVLNALKQYRPDDARYKRIVQRLQVEKKLTNQQLRELGIDVREPSSLSSPLPENPQRR